MSGQSIGSIAGAIVGAIAGFFTAGAGWAVTAAALAQGAAIGATAGGAIGGFLDPVKNLPSFGPRLTDLSQQTAAYATFLARAYGTMAFFGNVFWIEGNKLKEVPTTTTAGGKGGPPQSSQTTYKYYATFAVGLCEGPIFGIKRIWISGKLWYNKGMVHESTLIVSANREKKFKLFLGTETQMPPARMEEDKGIANCPAFRGRAYIVFYDFDVGNYGNSLAGVQVKVEVVKEGSYAYLFQAKGNAVTADRPNALDIQGNYAYVVNNNTSELGVYDISNPAAIKKVGALSIAGTNANSVKVYKKVAYVSDFGPNAIQTFDISDPKTPILRATYSVIPNPRSLFVTADYIYCLSGSDALYIFSKGGLYGEPVLVSTVPISAAPYDLFVSGDYAYIVCSSTPGILQIVNLANKAFPSVVSNLSLGASAFAVFVVDQYVFTSDSVSFKIFDASNILAPVLIGSATTTNTGSNSAGMWVDGNFAFLPTSTGAIDVLDISNKAAPVLNASSATGKGYSLKYNKNYIFAVDSIIPGHLNAFFFSPQIVPTYPALSAIVSAECLKSNLLTGGDIDVTQLGSIVRGYRVSSLGAIRSAIEPLQGAWPFDVIQDGYKIKFVARGSASVATITSDKLDARAAGQTPGIQITKMREMDSILPAKVSVKYLDVSREYDTSEQYYERINTDAINTSDLELPIVMTASEAAGTAQTLCLLYWLERYDVAFTLPPEYNQLQPADVVALTAPGASYNLRIKQINYTQDGRLEIQAKYNQPAIYTASAVGEEGNLPVDILEQHGDTVYQLLDIPLVQDIYDMPGFPVAMTGNLPGWPGGILSRSDDGGVTYNSLQGFTSPGTTMGSATNTVGAHPGTLLDKASVLNVQLNQGTLSSITELQLFNGGNYFAYGIDGRWEIMAAQNCILQADGSYNLSDLMRGRFGTELYTGTHAIGDVFALLSSTGMAFVLANTSMIGSLRYYKAVTSGETLDTVDPLPFTYKGVNLECLSPIYLNGNRNAANDWTLTWTRRGRINSEWKDAIDVPVGETSESYDIEIYSDGAFTTLKRTLTTTTPTAIYTSANQVTDFGSNQATLNLKIYQNSSSVGRGYPLATTITQN